MSGRVFDNDEGGADSVEGLIQLCDHWLDDEMVMVEVGCFRGVSTAIFASCVKQVLAVDPWTSSVGYTDLPLDMVAEAEKQFDAMLLITPNIVKIRKLSVDAAKDFEDGFLDAVYIDGDHRAEAVAEDLAAWIPKVKKGGLIMGHDFCQVALFLPAVTVYPEQSWIYIK